MDFPTNQSVVYLEGNPVEVFGLLGPTETPQTAPAVVNGVQRRQILLSDPLTGAILDLQAGGGGGAGTVKTVNGVLPDGSGALVLTPGNVLSIPQAIYGYDAAAGTPALTNGTPVTINGTAVYALYVTTPGALTIDGNTYNLIVGDIMELTPNVGNTALLWSLNPLPRPSAKVAATDASGNIIAATAGTDYAPGKWYSNSVLGFVPGSGNVTSTTGLVTFGTATVTSYTDGAWGFFPANALFAGQLATDAYWCVSSDTTHAQVYTAKWTPGVTSPAIPTSLVALTTVVGAYTQSTAAITIDKAPSIPGGALGAQGEINGKFYTRSNNSAGAKTVSITFNGTNVATQVNTTGTDGGMSWFVKNTGRVDRQFGSQNAASNITLFPLKGTVNTDTTPVTIALTATLAVATDTLEFRNLDFSYSRTPQS